MSEHRERNPSRYRPGTITDADRMSIDTERRSNREMLLELVHTTRHLKHYLPDIMTDLKEILDSQAAELADLGTIESNTSALIAAHNSDADLLAQLTAKIAAQNAAGNAAEAADLQQIADGLAKNRAAVAPILAALAAATGSAATPAPVPVPTPDATASGDEAPSDAPTDNAPADGTS